MGDIFSGSEIVEIGIQIEKNGRDFYNSLSGSIKNIKVQEVFKFLAREEEKHIKAFQGILEKAGKFKDEGLVSDDYFAYMSSLASEQVFTKENTGIVIAGSIKTEKAAVEKAINFERESVIFYEGIKKVVPGEDKKIVDYLIEQENMHLRQLTELLAVI
ncbi:MAG: ferritin family protein [Candidatus Omnitrophota bacterium]|jgi:rubrerythrin